MLAFYILFVVQFIFETKQKVRILALIKFTCLNNFKIVHLILSYNLILRCIVKFILTISLKLFWLLRSTFNTESTLSQAKPVCGTFTDYFHSVSLRALLLSLNFSFLTFFLMFNFMY